MRELFKQYGDAITEILGGLIGFITAIYFLFGNAHSLKTLILGILERLF